MRKQLCLDLDSLTYDYPTSEFDIGGRGHEIVIENENKTALINELTQKYKEAIKELLEVEYVCESCEGEHTERRSVFKCKKCKVEICDYCENERLCDDCISN